jgi:superfamily I DNA/RNA helicase
LIGEDKGGGKVSDISSLIEHALSIHQFDTLSEEALNAINRLKTAAQDFTDVGAFLDALSLDRGVDHGSLLGDRVALMSLHAAKGLEWPVVFITGCEDGLIPCTLFGDRNDEEERRLFYVGMTRARKSLILSHANHRMVNGRALHLEPSPLISLIPKELCEPLSRGSWKPKKSHKQLALF